MYTKSMSWESRCWLNSFIYFFFTGLCCMPGTVAGNGDTRMNKTFCLREKSLVREENS